ncbi:uncharacterized protein N7511_011340 [Penicillium nucicola]|uniref:uncharacterized protein n=1 Tax=Penicillium nucicola TaxID=1850975 RepID=UPI002545786B|nr:uncharacterized protein N7511_011340 [Penicillium nucicola]KAJ5742608.1 hypothetical protein N7511_011340 [Penicillium nucicola]
MAATTLFSCADPGCDKDSKYSCSNCKLVSYCDKRCQVAHWPEHKIICKSSLMKDNWSPCWEREKRTPSFSSPKLASNLHNPFGKGIYLWGNVPAIDVLNLDQNEGNNLSRDVYATFCWYVCLLRPNKGNCGSQYKASGDLRNVVKTVSELPQLFAQRIDLTINDRDFHVVARNAIILLFCLTALEITSIPPGGFANAESLIHLWYSASLPKNITTQLVSRVKPFFTEVCGQITAEATGEIVERTWNFSRKKSLRLVLRKEEWYRLEALCEVPSDLTQQKALHIRTATTLAPERRDFRDRWYFKDTTPSVRLSKQKFREDGLLLPFGYDRADFSSPNPTFYFPPFVWPMDDKADPLDGWPIREVAREQTMAKEDLYGKLYIYLRRVFRRFLDRLARIEINLELLNTDAIQLPETLQENKYARIEVSNITDAGYLGTRETLRLLSPLLQSPQENPHATIISAYLNAVMEMVKQGDDRDQTPNLNLLMEFLPGIDIFSLLRPESAQSLKLWDARTIVIDRHKFFERYIRMFRFDRISADLQVAMKDLHTVVETWPTKPILERGQQGSQDEFNILLGSNYTCVERFVEWRRME